MPSLYGSAGGANRKLRELYARGSGDTNRKLRELWGRDAGGTNRKVFSALPALTSVEYDYSRLSQGSITRRSSDFAVYYGAEQTDGREADIYLKFSEPFTVTHAVLYLDAYLENGNWNSSDIKYFNGEYIALSGDYNIRFYTTVLAAYLERPTANTGYLSDSASYDFSGQIYDPNSDHNQLILRVENHAGFYRNVTAYIHARITTNEFGTFDIPGDL